MNAWEHFLEWDRYRALSRETSTAFEYRLYSWLARWHRRFVPVSDVIPFAIRKHSKRIAENVVKNNAMFARLTSRLP